MENGTNNLYDANPKQNLQNTTISHGTMTNAQKVTAMVTTAIKKRQKNKVFWFLLPNMTHLQNTLKIEEFTQKI